MPVKLYLNGEYVGYNLSNYQIRSKKVEQSKIRYFDLKTKHRREITGSVLKGLYNTKPPFYLCFGTLTYKFPNELDSDFSPSNPWYNDHIKKFFSEIRWMGLCGGYIWTKELTKRGQIHYHAIFSWNFLGVPRGTVEKCVSQTQARETINRYWCDARGYYSGNAFRVGKDTPLILESAEKSAYYATKYATKQDDKNQKIFTKPAYRISNSWKTQPLKFIERIDDDIIENIDQFKVKDDFLTTYTRLNNLKLDDTKNIFDSISGF